MNDFQGRFFCLEALERFFLLQAFIDLAVFCSTTTILDTSVKISQTITLTFFHNNVHPGSGLVRSLRFSRGSHLFIGLSPQTKRLVISCLNRQITAAAAEAAATQEVEEEEEGASRQSVRFTSFSPLSPTSFLYSVSLGGLKGLFLSLSLPFLSRLLHSASIK